MLKLEHHLMKDRVCVLEHVACGASLVSLLEPRMTDSIINIKEFLSETVACEQQHLAILNFPSSNFTSTLRLKAQT